MWIFRIMVTILAALLIIFTKGVLGVVIALVFGYLISEAIIAKFKLGTQKIGQTFKF
jgi:hypothetical protein